MDSLKKGRIRLGAVLAVFGLLALLPEERLFGEIRDIREGSPAVSGVPGGPNVRSNAGQNIPPSVGPAPSAIETSEKNYVIGPNNLLMIKIVGEGTIPQTYRVDELGFITHPLVGHIKLGGMTVDAAEETLRTALQGDYILHPYVSIFVLEHSRFSILGEVNKAGNYEILGRLSIVDAISMAGGFTPVANEKRVRILRRDDTGEKTVIVNVQNIMDGKENDVYIQPGDIVNIQKSFF